MIEIKKLIEQDKFKEAEKLFLKSGVSKKTQEDNLLLSELLYLQERHQQVIHCGEALLLLGYKADANFYFMLGTSYLRLEQYDKAVSNLVKGIKLNPDDAKAHNNLGIVYEKKGEYDRAIACCKKGIEEANKS